MSQEIIVSVHRDGQRTIQFHLEGDDANLYIASQPIETDVDWIEGQGLSLELKGRITNVSFPEMYNPSWQDRAKQWLTHLVSGV